MIHAWHDTFGLLIHDGYGQTETTLLAANLPGLPIRPGSMGKPFPGHDVRVIGDDGEELGADDIGDLAVRGHPPSLFREYWKDPDETAACRRGEWYVTGDRGRRDADGYLWFVGRADDVIISAGYRIGPFEVESALLEHAWWFVGHVVGFRNTYWAATRRPAEPAGSGIGFGTGCAKGLAISHPGIRLPAPPGRVLCSLLHTS